MAELRKQETNPLKPDAHEDRQQLLRAYYARKMDIQNQIAELEAEWGDLMRKIKTVEDRNA